MLLALPGTVAAVRLQWCCAGVRCCCKMLLRRGCYAVLLGVVAVTVAPLLLCWGGCAVLLFCLVRCADRGVMLLRHGVAVGLHHCHPNAAASRSRLRCSRLEGDPGGVHRCCVG